MSASDDVARIRAEAAADRKRRAQERARIRASVRELTETARIERENHELARQANARIDSARRRRALSDLQAEVARIRDDVATDQRRRRLLQRATRAADTRERAEALDQIRRDVERLRAVWARERSRRAENRGGDVLQAHHFADLTDPPDRIPRPQPAAPTVTDRRSPPSMANAEPPLSVDDLTAIEGIDAATQRRLYLAGILSFRQLTQTPPEVLFRVVGQSRPFEQWQDRARVLLAGGAQ